MSAIRSAAKRVLQAAGLYLPWKLSTRGPLKDDGWLRSFHEGRPVDAEGRPIPWLSYPVIEFLAARVRKEWSVFEYGAGASTLWWGARVREVVTVEHDAGWAKKIRGEAPANVELLEVALEYGGEYARTAARWPARFDVVVIDGRDRVNCANSALVALKPEGVIIWDNSDREEYRPGFEMLAQAGFRRVPFIGLLPVHWQKNETSILYRDGNVLGL